MPPVSRATQTDGRRTGMRSGTRHRRSYVSGSNRKPLSRGKRQTASIIPVKTYSNKEETIDIEYRCLMDFSHQGGDNGPTPTLIRINMNNPLIGGPNAAAGNDNIVTCVLNTGSSGDLTQPKFNMFSLDNKKNLADRLKEYTDIYRDVVVLKSEAQVRVIPKLNPINPTNGVNGRSVVNYWTNVNATGDLAGNTLPRIVLANALSEVDVWTIRQQEQGKLTNNTLGSPLLEELKADYPNLRMKRLNVTPNNKKGVTFKQKYTPKSQFGFQSWKDNRQQVACFNNAVKNPNQKDSYMYVGLAGRYTSWDDDPLSDPEVHYPYSSVTKVGLPLHKVEISVKYRINFSQRLNIEGANEPTPHAGDL